MNNNIETTNGDHHLVSAPTCPSCGSEYLYNAQEVTERLVYRILPRLSPGDDVRYGTPEAEWTDYGESVLLCGDCGWEIEFASVEARELLGLG